MLQRAFDDYRQKSCINIRPKVDSDISWVNVTKDTSGCWSFVGMIASGSQQLNLQAECFYYYGTVLHEFLHALGIYHEQSRYDRDNYLYVALENVQAGMNLYYHYTVLLFLNFNLNFR